MNQMKKSAPQTAKGKMRASKAQRDANGRFLKAGQEDYRQNELFVVQPEHQPGYQPESSLYITTTTHELDAEKKRKPFEQFVLSAMEDTFQKELIGQKPNRYEDFDPVTGQRSYCGIPIPPDAPPRADENMVWNKVTI
jgi:hypothetical protein